jgi:hypothetical protein
MLGQDAGIRPDIYSGLIAARGARRKTGRQTPSGVEWASNGHPQDQAPPAGGA